MASRSRPTTEWMFRGRARSSKWFVRSCSRSVHWLHWPWSLAKLRQLSVARLRSQPSAARSRLRSAVQLRAVPLQAAPLLATAAPHRAAPHRLAVLAVPHRAAPHRLAAPAPLVQLRQQLLRTLRNLRQPSKLSLTPGSLTACGSLSREPFLLHTVGSFHAAIRVFDRYSTVIVLRDPGCRACRNGH